MHSHQRFSKCPKPTPPAPTAKKLRPRGRSLPAKPTVPSNRQCLFHLSGTCRLGSFCRFQHGWARPVFTAKKVVYQPKMEMVEEAIKN